MPYLCYNKQKNNRGYNCKKYIVIAAIQQERIIEMTQVDREKNLIIVAAIDQYADVHGISNLEAFELFNRFGLLKLLRDNYDTLHTQGLFEGAMFAEDYIARNSA
jgi:hypothetical protein